MLGGGAASVEACMQSPSLLMGNVPKGLLLNHDGLVKLRKVAVYNMSAIGQSWFCGCNFSAAKQYASMPVTTCHSHHCNVIYPYVSYINKFDGEATHHTERNGLT